MNPYIAMKIGMGISNIIYKGINLIEVDTTLGITASGGKGMDAVEDIKKVKEISVDNKTKTMTPSELAKSWQGTDDYPGIDRYRDITIKKGKIIYRGEPNGTEYFTTKLAIERSECNATKIFEGLQVEKHSVHGYRSNMQGYEATINIDAAFGITKANPRYGKGGLPQIFVPDAEELIDKGYLVPIDNIPLKK